MDKLLIRGGRLHFTFQLSTMQRHVHLVTLRHRSRIPDNRRPVRIPQNGIPTPQDGKRAECVKSMRNARRPDDTASSRPPAAGY